MWFMDRELENAIVNVELQVIIKHVSITILYYNNNNNSNDNSIKIREILYKYNGHWKLRNVKYSY